MKDKLKSFGFGILTIIIGLGISAIMIMLAKCFILLIPSLEGYAAIGVFISAVIGIAIMIYAIYEFGNCVTTKKEERKNRKI